VYSRNVLWWIRGQPCRQDVALQRAQVRQQRVGIGGNGLIDTAAKYYLGSSAIILIISAVGAFPLPAKLGNMTLKKPQWPVYVSVVWFAALLFLCIAGMMVSTYSSFLYFQF